jgi:hypothetical protein
MLRRNTRPDHGYGAWPAAREWEATGNSSIKIETLEWPHNPPQPCCRGLPSRGYWSSSRVSDDALVVAGCRIVPG